MGRMQRVKGQTYERWLANTIRATLGPAVARQVRRGIGQARSGGEVSDVAGLPGFWIEAKHHARVNERAALAQAILAEQMSRTYCATTGRLAGLTACPTPDVRERGCKCRKRCSNVNDVPRIPIAICRDNNRPDVVRLRLTDFLTIVLPYLEAVAAGPASPAPAMAPGPAGSSPRLPGAPPGA